MKIFGLNIEPQRNVVVSNSALPKHLVQVVSLRPTPAYNFSAHDKWAHSCQKVIPIMLDCLTRHKLACYIEPLYVPHFEPIAELYMDAGFHPLQKKWLVEELYLTSEFFDPNEIDDPPLRELHTGVVIQNHVIAVANSVDPSVHSPIEVSDSVGQAIVQTVNGLFDGNGGVWNRSLLPLENEVLIKARAALAGEDPIVAWNDFQAAGFDHHLQFMTI